MNLSGILFLRLLPHLPPSLSSGDFTARLWKLPGQSMIMADEDNRPIYDEPVVLRHASKVGYTAPFFPSSLPPSLPPLFGAHGHLLNFRSLTPSLPPFRPRIRART